MTFTAIVTAHAQDPSKILGNLLYQTRKPDQVIVLHSDVDSALMFKLERDFEGRFELIFFLPRVDRQDWGHEKRAEGLEIARGDALGFFNADDSYDDRYVELMMAEIEAGADVAYCEWSGVPRCGFGIGSSTSGNFVVKTDIARKAGYTDRHYEADGTFIERIRSLTGAIARVEPVLYFHNIQ